VWVYLENYNTEGEERAAAAPPRPSYGDYGGKSKTEVHARYEQSPFSFSSSQTNKKEQRMYSIAKLLSISPRAKHAQNRRHAAKVSQVRTLPNTYARPRGSKIREKGRMWCVSSFFLLYFLPATGRTGGVLGRWAAAAVRKEGK